MDPEIGPVLKNAAAKPEQPPDIEQLVRRGHQSRQRRRAALLATPVAILSLLVAGIVVLGPPWSTETSPTKLHVVGSPPSRSITPTPPSPSSTAIPAGTPACPPSSLNVRVGGGWIISGGAVTTGISFSNVGKAPCYLEGQPVITFFNQQGQQMTVQEALAFGKHR